MACRRRRPHQCPQTGTWPRLLSGAWLLWFSMLGWLGCDRWQPGSDGPNVTLGAIRLSRCKKTEWIPKPPNHIGAKHFGSPITLCLLPVLHRKLIYAGEIQKPTQ